MQRTWKIRYRAVSQKGGGNRQASSAIDAKRLSKEGQKMGQNLNQQTHGNSYYGRTSGTYFLADHFFF